MTIISYAQNYEDVMLWRALKHVEKGFYIDVGAWSPDIDSVTKFFYQNNWSGINVEPNPEFHGQYASRRSRDVNLRMAVGDKEGCIVINFMTNPGLSTAIDEFAKQHESAGWSSTRQEVQLTTLSVICKEHIKPDQPIHFLKVDVEGLELAVLRGNDWTVYRPWIVVVEATLPMSQIESYEDWEPILLNGGYVFAYADGLNRFYVAGEHTELMGAFKYPPNVFDGFLLSSQLEAVSKFEQAESKAQQAESKAQQAESKAQQAEFKAQQAEFKAQQAEFKAQQAESKAQQAESKAQQAESRAQQAEVVITEQARRLVAIYSSKSWRITAPLRWPVHQWRLLSQHGPKPRAKALAKKLVRDLLPFVMARPALILWCNKLAHRFGMAKRLKSFVRGTLESSIELRPFALFADIEHDNKIFYLDKRAKRVLADLSKKK